MRGRRALAALVALPALALVASACLFGDDGDDADTPDGPTATAAAAVPPEEALRIYVDRRLNQGFVADCVDAVRPDDVGKQCATLRGERDGMLAYELGPTFSEYTRLLILQQAGETWTIVHQENRNPDEPEVAGIPWPLQVGADVIVTGTGDCLRVRERAGVQAPEVACIDDGTAVTIVSGPISIDDFEWWELESYGWSAGTWLRYPEEAPPTPEPES